LFCSVASEKKFDLEVEVELRRLKKLKEKEKEKEENRNKVGQPDPNSHRRVQSDGVSIPRERDGNSISRLAGRHLKTNLTKNVERDSTSMQRIRDSFSSADSYDPGAGGNSASRISGINPTAHNAAMHVNTNFGGLGAIIEAPDLQTPSSPLGRE
jgi:hypothetical protein